MASGQLGWVVSWRVPATVPLDTLRKAIKSAGIPADLLGELHNEQALRRALREMSDSRVIRKLRREGDKVYFQVTRETLTASEASYERECEVALDVTTGIVDGSNSAIAEQAKTLLDSHLAKRLTIDLTRLLQRYFETGKGDLVPIREQGGAYFVPEAHATLVERSRTLLKAIGGRLRSFAVKMEGEGETAKSVADSIAEYMGELLAEFKLSCDGISEDTRADAKRNRLEKIVSLKTKLEMYRGLMQGYADRVEREVTGAEDMLVKMLATKAPAEPTPV